MSLHEVFTQEPTQEEKAAEATVAQILENLRQFELGDRDTFGACFALNIDTFDEYGRGNGVNDIAHGKFLDLLDVTGIDDDYFVLSSGTKIYYQFLVYEGEDYPFAASYQSEPFLGLGE